MLEPAGTVLVLPAAADRATHRPFPPGNPRYYVPISLPGSKAIRHFLSMRSYLLLRARAFLAGLSAHEAPQWAAESPVLVRLKALAGHEHAEAVVSLGTPGPYNKATVLLMTDADAPLMVAKFGRGDAVTALLKNEAAWLSFFDRAPGLRSQVPRLVAAGPLDDGYVVVQGGVKGEVPTSRAEKRIWAVLAEVQRQTELPSAFRDSEMRLKMGERATTLASQVTPTWRKRSEMALRILDEALGASKLPMVIAHRDFSAWNMRVDGDKVYIFDWEYCSRGYIPLYDWYHYKLMPIAQRRTPSKTDIRTLLTESIDMGPYLGVEMTGSADFQLLAYFVDICLFYLESNEGRDDHDVIVKRYSKLIDRFETWRLT